MERSFWLGPWYVDTLRQHALRDQTSVPLSVNEAELLAYLHAHSDRGPISREEILVQVYRFAPGLKSRAVDMGLQRLRRKLEVDPKAPELVMARRGKGLYLQGVRDGAAPSASVAPPPGRAALVTTIATHLETSEVVTLVGPSGIGKSCIAEYFESTEQAFWVGLANRTDAAGLIEATAGVLQCAEPAIPETLRNRNRLLILDNFEQLDDEAARTVASWSGACPILVTSIRPLRVRTEQVVAVPELGHEVAVEVLLEQARRAGAETQESQARAVVEKVGGHPLALLLLAPAVDLVHELDETDLLHLDSDRPDHPDRHRSLDSALDRAMALLSAPTRQGLIDLSIFAQRFDLDAVRALCGAKGLLQVKELVRWGLLQQLGGGELQLPPVVALHARARPRSPGTEGRYRDFLLSLGEHVRVHGLPPGPSRYAEDVMRELATIDDADLFALALIASILRLPPDVLSRAIGSRSLDVPHGDALLALRSLISRDPVLHSKLQSLDPGDPVVRLAQLDAAMHAGEQPVLSRAEFEALRDQGHPLAWSAMLIGLSPMVDNQELLEALDVDIHNSRERGWTHHVAHLLAARAAALFRVGSFVETYAVLADIDADRLHAVPQIYLIAAACQIGALGPARVAADKFVEFAKLLGHPEVLFRALTSSACVAYLSGEPATPIVNEALLAPARGHWLGLALLVLRQESGSTESVGVPAFDEGLRGGVIEGNRPGHVMARLLLA